MGGGLHSSTNTPLCGIKTKKNPAIAMNKGNMSLIILWEVHFISFLPYRLLTR